MAGNSIGHIFRLTSFGESHGSAVGGVIDGCPAGLEIDYDFINFEIQRRKTGQFKSSSTRKEEDIVEFLSGIFENKSTGTPIAFLIKNKDQNPGDYDHLKNSFRPSHADFTYQKKYGIRDHRGGGRASARETIVRVVAGAVAKLFLKTQRIQIQAYVSQIGDIAITKDYSDLNLSNTETSSVRCPDKNTSQKMISYLDKIRSDGDTVGGIVFCIIKGVPVGLGEPIYDKLEANLAKAIMSINAVKGFDVGSGFKAAKERGSQHNDKFVVSGGKVITESNYSGGIQGGISNGMDIYFSTAFKPVATLMQDQVTVDKKGKTVKIEGKGRHDVCIVPRAVPVVEAMAALTIADMVLRNKNAKL